MTNGIRTLEPQSIDEATTLEGFAREVRSNAAYYRLAQGI